MICANCRRPLKHPAAEVGRMQFGRTCARNLSLIEQTTPRLIARDRIAVKRDPHTPDLFADEDQAQ
jgi:hypothetical protein